MLCNCLTLEDQLRFYTVAECGEWLIGNTNAFFVMMDSSTFL